MPKYMLTARDAAGQNSPLFFLHRLVEYRTNHESPYEGLPGKEPGRPFFFRNPTFGGLPQC